MNQIEENIILERYLRMAALQIEGATIKPGHFNFNCNVCNDGTSGKNKRRGHVLLTSPPGKSPFWLYKCYNVGECACATEKPWPAAKWLKVKFPNLHSLFRKELLKSNNSKKNNNRQKLKDETKKQNAINEWNDKRKTEKNKAQEKKSVENFKPILKGEGEIFEKAIKFCQDRKIPDKYWKKFFVCTLGNYENRLIIPFYDKRNNIYYFQARALLGQEPKYKNRVSSKENALFNWFVVDRKKPVHILEGPFDSMLVENSIATLGLGVPDTVQKELDKMPKRWLLDNDIAGKTSSLKMLKKGDYVFRWDKFLKKYRLKDIKDINDAYLQLKRTEPFSTEELSEFFTNSYYDSLYFKV